MIHLPKLSPAQCVEYMQLRWKLDVLDAYTGLSCGLYGCDIVQRICPTCQWAQKEKDRLWDKIINLSDDPLYKQQMKDNFVRLMDKLKIAVRDNPEILQHEGIHPDVMERNKEIVRDHMKQHVQTHGFEYGPLQDSIKDTWAGELELKRENTEG